MNNKIKKFTAHFIVLMFTFLINPASTQAGFPSMYEKGKEMTNVPKSNQDIDIENLLGPEENFPFLPDNHHDNSNPIGRIGEITEKP
tara:strand:- start:395 stop:655 length:261 start_codon:yes stop_codon:yes gene_type:complete